jgi:hypothetical protein
MNNIQQYSLNKKIIKNLLMKRYCYLEPFPPEKTE